MTIQDLHKRRHKVLHAYLEELVRDWKKVNGTEEDSLKDFLNWSDKQGRFAPDHEI